MKTARAEVEALLIVAEEYMKAVIREAGRGDLAHDLAAVKAATTRARTALLDQLERTAAL